MDDAFSFRTTVPIRRQLDPRLLKAGVLVGLLGLGLGFFAHWVIASERASFAHADRRHVAELDVRQIGAGVDPSLSDADAKDAVRMAIVAAKAAFTQRRSFHDAGPSQLTELQPGFIFVDGPSTMPRIVSIATSRRSWAAAVRSPSGTCFWARATGPGILERGTATECTGSSALTATALGW